MDTSPTLRPMNIGDLLDGAFRLYRRHFLTFIGIAALLQVPLAILQFVFQLTVGGRALGSWMRAAQSVGRLRPGQSLLDFLPVGDLLAYLALALLLGAVQYLLVYHLITGALSNAIARSYMGQRVSILEAYRLGWRRYLSLVGAAGVLFLVALLVMAVIFGCAFGTFAALLAARSSRVGALGAVVMVLLIFALMLVLAVLALYLSTRLLVTTQAIVLEQRGPLAGIGRSWQLVGGAFWRTLLTLLLMALLTYMVAALPATLLSFALNIVSRGSVDALMRNQAITTLLTQVGQIIMLPLQLGVYTLLYYDLRVRKEGYDLELMARQIQPVAPQ